MNQNLAPTFEDLNSPAIDVAQGLGEIAVLSYNDDLAERDSHVVTRPITFDSAL